MLKKIYIEEILREYSNLLYFFLNNQSSSLSYLQMTSTSPYLILCMMMA